MIGVLLVTHGEIGKSLIDCASHILDKHPVSVKSIEFDENRNETTIDYKKMLKIVKESGYTGFLGVEWESDTRPPEEGIRLTKELIERSL